ncbi:MAG: CPBP family intramembrane metalloprotease [Phycisphaerales bacterium]|nr:CPBP family intramembrane metalloprotease [Phycisphaerales bacterium]
MNQTPPPDPHDPQHPQHPHDPARTPPLWKAPQPAEPALVGPRCSGWLSWAVILLAVASVIIGQVLLTIASTGGQISPDDEAATAAMLELQCKVVFAAELLSPGAGTMQLADINQYAITPGLTRRLAALNASLPTTPESEARQRNIEQALGLLAGNTNEEEEPTELDALVHQAILGETPLDTAQVEMLDRELGWFGQVLTTRDLPPTSPDRRAIEGKAMMFMGAIVVLLIVGGLAGLAGLVLLIIGLVNRYSGSLVLHRGPVQARGGVYLQAFAVYLGLYLIVTQGVLMLLGATGLLDRIGLSIETVGMTGLVIASVVAVVWPILRGVPGAMARSDLGLHRGRGILTEIGCGIIGYFSILPIFGMGVIATLILGFIMQYVLQATGQVDPNAPPQIISHPVLVWISQGGFGVRLGVLLLAACFAPFFEEIMFRGALFADLRRRMSFIPAALLMALIFAAIHPQGIVAVPALASLAFGFAILREWRGSLIAPMVAHALHNGTLVMVMIIAFM